MKEYAVKLLSWMPDKMYLKLRYRLRFKKKLDLKAPKTLNEKMQWMKLNDKNPIYPIIVDKCAAKEYIAEKIGEKYIIPTLGVYDSFDEIDFDALPDSFVLKCTHDSKSCVVVKDKSKMDKAAARKKLTRALKHDFYYNSREWPYRSVPRKIICEKYMQDSPDVDCLTDYKFYCFDGYADSVMLCTGRSENHVRFFYFTKDWKLKKYNRGALDLPDDFTIPKIEQMDEMFALAEQLSKGFPFLRVDFYCCNGQIYFGELTIFSSGGFDAGFLPWADEHFGSLVKLEMIEKQNKK